MVANGLRKSCSKAVSLSHRASNISTLRTRSTSLIVPTIQSRPQSRDSRPHHDLPTFLDYAQRTSLSPRSTVYRGTRYEYNVAACLRRLRFTLFRTGGRADHGIDLVGSWPLPDAANALTVCIQCKASTKAALGPEAVRELEGAAAGASRLRRLVEFEDGKGDQTPPGERIMAFLVAPRPATPGIRDALSRSGAALGFMMMGAGDDPKVEQIFWNQTAAESGLHELRVDMRFLDAEQCQKEAVLIKNGEPWEDVVTGA